MTSIAIGYVRCSTDKQLAAQKGGSEKLRVFADPVYTDHGLTETNRARACLDQVLAAVRSGATLLGPKLDRLARSVPDARTIADDLIGRVVQHALVAGDCDHADPMGEMFFNILAKFAAFGPDLIRMRTREGMAVARVKEKLSCKRPKISGSKGNCVRETSDYSISDLAEVFFCRAAYGLSNHWPASSGRAQNDR